MKKTERIFGAVMVLGIVFIIVESKENKSSSLISSTQATGPSPEPSPWPWPVPWPLPPPPAPQPPKPKPDPKPTRE